MNKNVKVSNPMKVITGPDTRWSYANVWEPKSINGGTPKYSVSLIIPKSDTKTVAKIKAAIEAAYKEGESKLKGNGKSVPALSVIKTPLRDGDLERPDDTSYANAYFVNAIVMHIHDELVIEADPKVSLDAICEQMGRTPPWAKGLLLRADGYTTPFYKKD